VHLLAVVKHLYQDARYNDKRFSSKNADRLHFVKW